MALVADWLMPGHFSGDARGVLAHPEQERRPAGAQKVHAAEVQSWDHHAGPIVGDREAHGVECRKADPAGVVRAKAGCEDHCGEPTQVELDRRFAAERWRVRPMRSAPAELGCQQPAEVRVPGIAPSDRFGQAVGETYMMPVDAGEPADQLNAQRLQRPVVQVVAAVLAGGLLG